jgi:hypothetical protein
MSFEDSSDLFCPQQMQDDMHDDPILHEYIEKFRIDPTSMEKEHREHPGYMQYYTAKHLEAEAKYQFQKANLAKLEGQAVDILLLSAPRGTKLSEKKIEHRLNQDERILEQRAQVIAARLEVGYWKGQIERGKEKLAIITTIANDNRVDKKYLDPSRYIGTKRHEHVYDNGNRTGRNGESLYHTDDS